MPAISRIRLVRFKIVEKTSIHKQAYAASGAARTEMSSHPISRQPLGGWRRFRLHPDAPGASGAASTFGFRRRWRVRELGSFGSWQSGRCREDTFQTLWCAQAWLGVIENVPLVISTPPTMAGIKRNLMAPTPKPPSPWFRQPQGLAVSLVKDCPDSATVARPERRAPGLYTAHSSLMALIAFRVAAAITGAEMHAEATTSIDP